MSKIDTEEYAEIVNCVKINTVFSKIDNECSFSNKIEVHNSFDQESDIEDNIVVEQNSGYFTKKCLEFEEDLARCNTPHNFNI